MNDTIIYLIRHSEQYKDYTYNENLDNERELNKKIILSVDGEKYARELSRLKELEGIDKIYSSDYVRAIGTAKYIAVNNNLKINIDDRLGERCIGKVTIVRDKKNDNEIVNEKIDYTKMQLINPNLKNEFGESNIEVQKRMEEVISQIVKNNKGRRIAIVSHGAAIKFYLTKYCLLNERYKLEYKGKELEITSPSLLKLFFKENQLMNIKQIEIKESFPIF